MRSRISAAVSATGINPTTICPIVPVSYTHLDVYKRQAYRPCHTLYPGDHRVYDRLAKDRGRHGFHRVSDAADYLLNLAADRGQHAPQAFGGQPIPVHKADRAVISEQIGIEGLGNQQIGGIDVFLAEPVQGRLILPCAQVEHAGGSVVGFGVVGESADLHVAHLLAIGGVGTVSYTHLDVYKRQSLYS